MKSPPCAISCSTTKMLALCPIGHVREAVNLKLWITVTEIEVDAAAEWKRRCLGTKYRHLTVRAVSAWGSGDVALLQKEAAGASSCAPLEHPVVAEWVLNTLVLALNLVVEVGLHVHDVGGWIESAEVSIVEHFWVASWCGTETHHSNKNKEDHCWTVTDFVLVVVNTWKAFIVIRCGIFQFWWLILILQFVVCFELWPSQYLEMFVSTCTQSTLTLTDMKGWAW